MNKPMYERTLDYIMTVAPTDKMGKFKVPDDWPFDHLVHIKNQGHRSFIAVKGPSVLSAGWYPALRSREEITITHEPEAENDTHKRTR